VDPYSSDLDRREMVEGWFVPTMPDLNQRNKYMSTYLIQNSIWWIEYANLYGIRQDTYSYPFKAFMTDWTCAIMDEYPNFNLVGEEWVEDDPALISYWQRNKENVDGYTSCLPSAMDFPLCFSIHDGLRDEEAWNTGLRKIYKTLAKDYHYPDANALVTFADNHDMSRIFTQVNEDYDLLKMAMTLLLTTRGVPQIYYGTEILMSNPGTESHGVIRSDFPGGWQNDKVNAFTGDGLTERQKEAQQFLKLLLNWRKDKDVIHDGKLMHFSPEDGIYCYFRYNETETLMVILNKQDKAVSLPLDRFKERLQGLSMAKDVLSGKSFNLKKNVELPARSSMILETY
jgi:glycosidase